MSDFNQSIPIASGVVCPREVDEASGAAASFAAHLRTYVPTPPSSPVVSFGSSYGLPRLLLCLPLGLLSRLFPRSLELV